MTGQLIDDSVSQVVLPRGEKYSLQFHTFVEIEPCLTLSTNHVVITPNVTVVMITDHIGTVYHVSQHRKHKLQKSALHFLRFRALYVYTTKLHVYHTRLHRLTLICNTPLRKKRNLIHCKIVMVILTLL